MDEREQINERRIQRAVKWSIITVFAVMAVAIVEIAFWLGKPQLLIGPAVIVAWKAVSAFRACASRSPPDAP